MKINKNTPLARQNFSNSILSTGERRCVFNVNRANALAESITTNGGQQLQLFEDRVKQSINTRNFNAEQLLQQLDTLEGTTAQEKNHAKARINLIAQTLGTLGTLGTAVGRSQTTVDRHGPSDKELQDQGYERVSQEQYQLRAKQGDDPKTINFINTYNARANKLNQETNNNVEGLLRNGVTVSADFSRQIGSPKRLAAFADYFANFTPPFHMANGQIITGKAMALHIQRIAQRYRGGSFTLKPTDFNGFLHAQMDGGVNAAAGHAASLLQVVHLVEQEYNKQSATAVQATRHLIGWTGAKGAMPQGDGKITLLAKFGGSVLPNMNLNGTIDLEGEGQLQLSKQVASDLMYKGLYIDKGRQEAIVRIDTNGGMYVRLPMEYSGIETKRPEGAFRKGDFPLEFFAMNTQQRKQYFSITDTGRVKTKPGYQGAVDQNQLNILRASDSNENGWVDEIKADRFNERSMTPQEKRHIAVRQQGTPEMEEQLQGDFTIVSAFLQAQGKAPDFDKFLRYMAEKASNIQSKGAGSSAISSMFQGADKNNYKAMANVYINKFLRSQAGRNISISTLLMKEYHAMLNPSQQINRPQRVGQNSNAIGLVGSNSETYNTPAYRENYRQEQDICRILVNNGISVRQPGTKVSVNVTKIKKGKQDIPMDTSRIISTSRIPGAVKTVLQDWHNVGSPTAGGSRINWSGNPQEIANSVRDYITTENIKGGAPTIDVTNTGKAIITTTTTPGDTTITTIDRKGTITYEEKGKVYTIMTQGSERILSVQDQLSDTVEVIKYSEEPMAEPTIITATYTKDFAHFSNGPLSGNLFAGVGASIATGGGAPTTYSHFATVGANGKMQLSNDIALRAGAAFNSIDPRNPGINAGLDLGNGYALDASGTRHGGVGRVDFTKTWTSADGMNEYHVGAFKEKLGKIGLKAGFTKTDNYIQSLALKGINSVSDAEVKVLLGIYNSEAATKLDQTSIQQFQYFMRALMANPQLVRAFRGKLKGISAAAGIDKGKIFVNLLFEFFMGAEMETFLTAQGGTLDRNQMRNLDASFDNQGGSEMVVPVRLPNPVGGIYKFADFGFPGNGTNFQPQHFTSYVDPKLSNAIQLVDGGFRYLSNHVQPKPKAIFEAHGNALSAKIIFGGVESAMTSSENKVVNGQIRPVMGSNIGHLKPLYANEIPGGIRYNVAKTNTIYTNVQNICETIYKDVPVNSHRTNQLVNLLLQKHSNGSKNPTEDQQAFMRNLQDIFYKIKTDGGRFNATKFNANTRQQLISTLSQTINNHRIWQGMNLPQGTTDLEKITAISDVLMQESYLAVNTSDPTYQATVNSRRKDGYAMFGIQFPNTNKIGSPTTFTNSLTIMATEAGTTVQVPQTFSRIHAAEREPSKDFKINGQTVQAYKGYYDRCKNAAIVYKFPSERITQEVQRQITTVTQNPEYWMKQTREAYTDNGGMTGATTQGISLGVVANVFSFGIGTSFQLPGIRKQVTLLEDQNIRYEDAGTETQTRSHTWEQQTGDVSRFTYDHVDERGNPVITQGPPTTNVSTQTLTPPPPLPPIVPPVIPPTEPDIKPPAPVIPATPSVPSMTMAPAGVAIPTGPNMAPATAPTSNVPSVLWTPNEQAAIQTLMNEGMNIEELK